MIPQVRRTYPLVLSGILVVLLAAPCQAAGDAYYTVRAEISATSEWVELSVEGAELLVDWWAPDSRINGLHVYTASNLRLEKPCCLKTPVTVNLDLLVFPSGTREVSWTLSRGSYGRARLKIFAMSGGGANLVQLADVNLRDSDDQVEGESRTVRMDLESITADAASGTGIDSSSPTFAEAESYLDIEYATVPGVDPTLLSLDLILPPRDLSDPPPLVVYIHGGGMVDGDKRSPEIYYDFNQVIGASYAVASINYRLMPDARFPEQLYDVRAAIQWLRTHADAFGYDEDRIALWGFSAGGCLALLAGLTEGVDELSGTTGDSGGVSSQVAAVCSYYGTADFRTMVGGAPWGYLGCEEGDVEFAAFASPVSHVSADDPPVFLLHGTWDQYLPVEQAETLHELLQKAGVTSQLVVVKGAMHGGQTGWWGEGPRAVRDFLDEHLCGD